MQTTQVVRREKRVLVVDDYPDTAPLVCAIAAFSGFTCRWATSGKEALAAADEFAPHVVVLDLGLPDMSGYEVARALRGKAGKRAFHLAALTGWATPADLARCHAGGFDQHVVKPASLLTIRLILEMAAQNIPELRPS